MIKNRKWLAFLMTAVMTASMGASMMTAAAEGPAETELPGETELVEEEVSTERELTNGEVPLVVGYSPFSSKFSPFFSETAYDQDVWLMTQLLLLSSDRMGAIIYNGIEGETINYNGTDYTYYGPADCTVTENEDGTVYYDFKLRDDLVFSDGEPITIDDVIFNMYVYCDPTYDGSTTLFSQPIEGLDEYRSGVETLFNLILEAGEDNDDFSLWTQEQQEAFFEQYHALTEAIPQEIVDF